MSCAEFSDKRNYFFNRWLIKYSSAEHGKILTVNERGRRSQVYFGLDKSSATCTDPSIVSISSRLNRLSPQFLEVYQIISVLEKIESNLSSMKVANPGQIHEKYKFNIVVFAASSGVMSVYV